MQTYKGEFMVSNTCSSSIIANNLKTNNKKATGTNFYKHEEGNKKQPNTQKVEYINGVKLEDLTQAIILSDHHNNPVLAKQFKTMLSLQCNTTVKGPKPDKLLKKQIFNFTVRLDTGKNQFEFKFDVRGDEVMADGSQLFKNLKTTSTRHGFVYEFDCFNLASILVVDVPTNLDKHYGHTNLNKAILALQRKSAILNIKA